ncbi:MAG TPA: hypothetical protein VJQ57_01315 [Acidimicrobiia bacterium]|nr:hypothetical protein [Acidimicrobiia bacterium]
MDDFHLEILRGSDLMGRWYLADVEVKREIAERFTLFLGDDEMEFLADDALVFAYEGVTRMQEGWVNAKKRKRRHRRAAADAARRKDEAPIEPAPAPAPVKVKEPTRPQATKKVPTSDLAKKLAAIASAEAAANDESEKRRLTWAEAEALELAEAAKSEPPPPAKKPRKRAAPKEEPAPSGPLYTEPYSPPPPPRTPPRVKSAATEPPAVAPAAAAEVPKEVAAPRPKRKRPPRPSIEPEPVAPEPVAPPPIQPPPIDEPLVEEPEYPEPSWIAPPPPARLVTVDLSVEEPLVIESPFAGSEAQEAPAPPEIEDEASDELTKRRQRRKSRRETAPDDQIQPDEETETRQITNIEAARGKVKEPKGAGHHPAETNVGLLAKLRRPPKADQEHVHTYEESRSAGGLTRRVCVECNHVSITSDD